MCLSSGDGAAQVELHCRDGLISNYSIASVPVGLENEIQGCWLVLHISDESNKINLMMLLLLLSTRYEFWNHCGKTPPSSNINITVTHCCNDFLLVWCPYWSNLH